MASTSQQPHSSFPARPYNNLRNPASTAFGTSQAPLALRQKSQLERSSKDNQAQVQHPGAPAAAPMNILSDEQREEINEAVCSNTIAFKNSMRANSQSLYRESHTSQTNICANKLSSSIFSTTTRTSESITTNSKLPSKPSVSTSPNPKF